MQIRACSLSCWLKGIAILGHLSSTAEIIWCVMKCCTAAKQRPIKGWIGTHGWLVLCCGWWWNGKGQLNRLWGILIHHQMPVRLTFVGNVQHNPCFICTLFASCYDLPIFLLLCMRAMARAFRPFSDYKYFAAPDDFHPDTTDADRSLSATVIACVWRMVVGNGVRRGPKLCDDVW